MKLQKDAEVIVVGVKKDWLKIQPPPESFSYVPKAFVNVHGDGKQGKVTSQIVVRAGSSMVQAKGAVQTQARAEPGRDDPGRGGRVLQDQAAGGRVPVHQPRVRHPRRPGRQAAGADRGRSALDDDHTQAPPGRRRDARGPTTGPSGSDVAAAPSTQPAGPDYIAELQRLELEFAEVSKKPLTEQPVADLMAEYQKLATTPGVPEITRKIADVRATTLKVRADALAQLEDAERKQKQFQDRMQAQRAEKQEIEERIKQLDIQVYAAVGTLRTSSLQVGKTTLYRLTDPATGRTVVYVWGTDPKIGELLGQFVGIKGPMQADSRLNLKVITPTATDAIDIAKVNDSVAAEVIPPSLVGKLVTAVKPAPAPAAPGAGRPGHPARRGQPGRVGHRQHGQPVTRAAGIGPLSRARARTIATQSGVGRRTDRSGESPFGTSDSRLPTFFCH